MTPPSGIYVHLPYCVRRCTYCTFVISTDVATREAYVQALGREFEFLSEGARGVEFDSIYFGGGTPSFLPAEDFACLLQGLRAGFNIAPDAEITAEANPDDVTPRLLEEWRRAGVTRISLGIQSLHDAQLSSIDRVHTAGQAREALAALLAARFSSCADLILGLPGQTRNSFLEDLTELAGTGLDHLSIYSLEVGSAHAISRDRELRPQHYLSEDEQAGLYLDAGEILATLGFRHYEVSNWARPGREALHNSKYWRRIPTLGFGVGAHEFWNGIRSANTASLAAYLDAVSRGRRPTAVSTPIAAEEESRERIVLLARTAQGVPAQEIDAYLDRTGDEKLREDWSAWQNAGLVQRREERFVLTERGFLVSNEMLCRFV